MIRNVLAAAVLISASFLVHAAKPVKLTPGNEGSKADQPYRLYTVECSNGKTHKLTSWNAGKQWCIGEISLEGCVKKQIKAAKLACKNS